MGRPDNVIAQLDAGVRIGAAAAEAAAIGRHTKRAGPRWVGTPAPPWLA
jgi:hypothetical protein